MVTVCSLSRSDCFIDYFIYFTEAMKHLSQTVDI